MKEIIAFQTFYENANSTVKFNNSKTFIDSIAAAINSTGYKVVSQSVTNNQWQKPSYFNQSLPALFVNTNKKKQCQQMPANIFMNVQVAKQYLNQNKAIVVCTVVMEQ